MHAVLLARHDVFMFKATLRSVDAAAVNLEDAPPEAICHSQAGAAESSGKPKRPPSTPAKFPSSCPVCLALVSAYAVSPGAPPAPCPPQTSVHVAFLLPQPRIPEFPKYRSPPNRGPPRSSEKA
jgi:Protein of unknown function (DUF2946)